MRKLLVILCFAFATPMHADALRDRIIDEFREDGFQEVRVNRTWLGRLRFVGEKPNFEREIVVDPNSGVILRDYLRRLRPDDASDDGAGDEEDEGEIEDGSDEDGGTGGEDDDDNGGGDDDDDDGDDDDGDDDDGDDDDGDDD